MYTTLNNDYSYNKITKTTYKFIEKHSIYI